MNKHQINGIETAIRPFRFGSVQEYLTIGAHLERQNIIRAMIREYLDHKIRELKKADHRMAEENRAAALAARQWEEKAPRCPHCGSVMKLSPGDDNDSHLWCPSCRYGQYLAKPVPRVLAEMGLVVKFTKPER